MKDYQKNSKLKETLYQKFGKVIYQEFYPKYSKPIIDKIDDELANHYGFTEEQKKFIVNFDRIFRIRDE